MIEQAVEALALVGQTSEVLVATTAGAVELVVHIVGVDDQASIHDSLDQAIDAVRDAGDAATLAGDAQGIATDAFQNAQTLFQTHSCILVDIVVGFGEFQRGTQFGLTDQVQHGQIVDGTNVDTAAGFAIDVVTEMDHVVAVEEEVATLEELAEVTIGQIVAGLDDGTVGLFITVGSCHEGEVQPGHFTGFFNVVAEDRHRTNGSGDEVQEGISRHSGRLQIDTLTNTIGLASVLRNIVANGPDITGIGTLDRFTVAEHVGPGPVLGQESELCNGEQLQFQRDAVGDRLDLGGDHIGVVVLRGLRLTHDRCFRRHVDQIDVGRDRRQFGHVGFQRTLGIFGGDGIDGQIGTHRQAGCGFDGFRREVAAGGHLETGVAKRGDREGLDSQLAGIDEGVVDAIVGVVDHVADTGFVIGSHFHRDNHPAGVDHFDITVGFTDDSANLVPVDCVVHVTRQGGQLELVVADLDFGRRQHRSRGFQDQVGDSHLAFMDAGQEDGAQCTPADLAIEGQQLDTGHLFAFLRKGLGEGFLETVDGFTRGGAGDGVLQAVTQGSNATQLTAIKTLLLVLVGVGRSGGAGADVAAGGCFVAGTGLKGHGCFSLVLFDFVRLEGDLLPYDT